MDQCLFCIDEIPSGCMNSHMQRCHPAMLSVHPSRHVQHQRSDVGMNDLNFFLSNGCWNSRQQVSAFNASQTVGPSFNPKRDSCSRVISHRKLAPDCLLEPPSKRRKLTHQSVATRGKQTNRVAPLYRERNEDDEQEGEAEDEDQEEEEEEEEDDGYCGLPYLWHLATYCEPNLERCGPYDVNRRIDIYEALQLQALEQTIKSDSSTTEPSPMMNAPCAWHSTQHKHDHTLSMSWTERDQTLIHQLVNNHKKSKRHKPAVEHDMVLLAHARKPANINDVILNDLQHYNFIRDSNAPLTPPPHVAQVPIPTRSNSKSRGAFISGVTASNLTSPSSSTSVRAKSGSPRRTTAMNVIQTKHDAHSISNLSYVNRTNGGTAPAPAPAVHKPTASPAASTAASTNGYNLLLLPTLNIPALNTVHTSNNSHNHKKKRKTTQTNAAAAASKPGHKQQQNHHHQHQHHHHHHSHHHAATAHGGGVLIQPKHSTSHTTHGHSNNFNHFNHNHNNHHNSHNGRSSSSSDRPRHTAHHDKQQSNSLQVKQLLAALARHPNFGTILQQIATDDNAKSQLLAALRETAAKASATGASSPLQSNGVIPSQFRRANQSKPKLSTVTTHHDHQHQHRRGRPQAPARHDQHRKQASLPPVVEVPSLVRCPPTRDNVNESPTSSTTITSMSGSAQQMNSNNRHWNNFMAAPQIKQVAAENNNRGQQEHLTAAALQELLANNNNKLNEHAAAMLLRRNGEMTKQQTTR